MERYAPLFSPLAVELTFCLRLLPFSDSISRLLPAIVGESFVRLSHAVHIFFFLDRGALAIRGIEQLVRELIGHTLFGAAAAIEQQPADGERSTAIGIHFDRHLIVRATDAAGLHFEQRLGVLDGLLEQLQGFVAAFFLHLRHGGIEDALSGGLFATPHHRVHELGDQGGVVDGISRYFTLRNVTFSWHYFFCSKLFSFALSREVRARRPYLHNPLGLWPFGSVLGP